MEDWILRIVDALGEPGIGGLVALESLVPPIPSEVVLPLGGFRARTGDLLLPLVWLWATVGSLVGAWVLYALGAVLGYDRLHRLAGHRWFFVLSQRDLDRGDRFFADHGGKVVLIGRCVPVLRSLVSVPAGLRRMALGRFTLLTALGSGVWNAAFVGAGYLLGDRWGSVQGALRPVTYVIVVALVGALVVLAVRRHRHHAAAR